MTSGETTAARTDVPSDNAEDGSRSRSLYPLLLDAVLPVGLYYLARYGLDLSIVTALIVSSILPVLRATWSITRPGEFNRLATLVLVVNIAGIALSFVSGNARVILAKDSGITAVVAVGLLISAARGRSLLSVALKPWLTRGDPRRMQAWEQLSTRSARFQLLAKRYDFVWGWCLFGDCVLRLVFVFTLPVADVAGWISTVVLVVAIALASTISAVASAAAMSKLIDFEAQRTASTGPRELDTRAASRYPIGEA